MNYDLFTGEHEQFRRQVSRFLAEKVTPFAPEWEMKREIPRSIWGEMGRVGFLGFCYDQAYGGVGADELFRIVMAQELALCGAPGFGISVTAHNDMSTTYINLLGNHEQKLRWLTPCIAGEKVCAIAVTEPGAGSDVAGIATRAEKKGDQYIINGQKTFITNGYYGDLLVTAVKTDLKATPPYKGISLIVIEKGTPGVSARKLEKIGGHISETAEIFFEDVEVPANHLLGQEGMGFFAIMTNFQLERLIAGILCVEIAGWILDKTIDHAKQRIAFGKPIGKFQVIRHKLADMATAIELNRALGYQCANQFSRRVDVTMEISMFKASASEMVNRVVYDATQILGGYGYMAEYEVAKLYPDLRAVTIAGGTTEIMKDIISRLMGI
ncbi:MAG: acyl-CoA dehydrogenase family protein [Syntrophales bacterium]